MKISFFMSVILALVFISGISAAENATIANAFQMDGVAGFVEGRAREALKIALSEKGSEWMADAIAKVLNRGRGGEAKKIDWQKIFYQDAETKRLVEAEIKERLKEYLPGAVKKILVENVFGGIAGEETLKEAKEIADRVAREMDTSFNERVDAVVGGWYDGTVATIRRQATQAGVPGWVDVTDIKGTIGRAFDLGNIGDMVSGQMGEIIGDATVTGIRGRIEDALNGQLPPEAIAAIKRGPEEFDKYVRRAESYLPGNQLRNLANSILNKPLIKIPTPAYASMLAASAAGHFARAYDGVFVNPQEIKRGIEVTRVMVWQLQNKEWINLSIMQIANIARGVAVNFGAGIPFDGAMSKIKKPIEKLQGHLDKLDRMIMKPIKDIQKEMKEITDELQKELLEIQEKLARPVRENIKRIEEGLNEAGELISRQIPDELNGIPADWEELKKRAGLENGVFGKMGDKTPRDILKDAAKDLGLDKTGEEIKKKLSDLNDTVAGGIAKGAGEALEAAHLLGPAAAILGIEKKPPQNASKSKELDPVLLYNGEFESETTDVVVPGRGIDFRFTRTYASFGKFLGELGRGWTHSYAERLLAWNDGEGDGLTYIDEGGRKFFFKEGEGGYEAPKGLYLKLSRSGDGYEMSATDGRATAFDSAGRPIAKRDRHGNAIKYVYDEAGLVASIIDVYGREVKFERRPDGLISAIKDFAGRVFSFEYNDRKELIGARSPATPDFPKGKLTAYRYDENAGYHSLSMIMDPNGRVYLKNKYDSEGRVAAQSYGEGQWMTARYEPAREGETVASRAWVTDAMGTTRLYEQDKEGHLLNLWRYDGEKYYLFEYNRYDEDGEAVARCLPSGMCEAYTYENGEIVRIESLAPDGKEARVATIEREGSLGRPSRVRDPAGIETLFEYEKAPPHNLLSIKRRDKNNEWKTVSQFQYDSAGQIVIETDERGGAIFYEYYPACDPDGDGVKVGGCPSGESGGGYLRRVARSQTLKIFEYDPIGNIISVTDETGAKTAFRVNALNQITKERAPGLAAREYFFDANDNLKKVAINLSGKVVTHDFDYDVLGRKTRERFEIDEGRRIETAYDYDSLGNLFRVTRPEGNADEYEYDFEGRPMCVTRGANSPEKSRECVARNEDGDITAFIDGEGFKTAFDLNGFGEVVAKIDPLGNGAEFGRDAAGRVISRRDFDSAGKLLAEAEFTYDMDGEIAARKRKLWRDDPSKFTWVREAFASDDPPTIGEKEPDDGKKWKYSYDGLGNLTSAIDPQGIATALTYDYIGRPLSIVRDAKGLRLTTRYEWNGNGMLAKVIAPDGGETRFIYDALDRLIAEQRASGAQIKAAHDRRDLVTQSIDANGSVLNIEYDANGRPVSRKGTPVGGVIGTLSQKFKYDGLGRIVEAEDEAGASQSFISRFVNDSLSRPVSEEADGRQLGREYDDSGNVVALFLPSGEKFFYSYDSGERLASVMRGGGRIAAMDYDDIGAISEMRLGDKMFLKIERDLDGLEHTRTYIDNSGEWLAGTEAFYDSEGNVLHETGYAGIDRFYKRDSIGRLVEASEIAGGHDEEGSKGREWRYEYSANGGRKNPASRMKRDAAGNVISDGAREFRYDIFGRLSGIWEGSRQIASYRYDAFDRRVAKIVDGVAANAAWDGWLLAEESAGDSGYVDYVYAGGAEPIAAMSDKGADYLLADRLGSVIASASADGKVTARCAFDPFGGRISVMPPGEEPPPVDEDFVDCEAYRYAFGFAGQIHDAESGLVYMRERYYDPKSGEFITPDPLGFKMTSARENGMRMAPALSYHVRQGAVSRATYPNRPFDVSEFYGAYPFSRAFFSDNPPFMPGETDLFAYAENDPSMFTDPLGLARMVFDRSDEKITLIDGGWAIIGTYSASNITTKPRNDPFQIEKNGPFPNGTYSLGIPEFYSSKYRDQVMAKYNLGKLGPGEGVVNGKAWKPDRLDTPAYSMPYGKIRIRAGSPRGTKEDKIVFARQLFLHGGRHDYKSKTLGCIREDDADIEEMAAEFIRLQRDGDPVAEIVVQE